MTDTTKIEQTNVRPKIVILTGAGISKESGVDTFRDAEGLWEGHNVEEIATPSGFQKNPQMVLDFYNKMRSQLKTVEPNDAHIALKKLESKYNVTIITQNVDDLHERAKSTSVIHLHGQLNKMRSSVNESIIFDYSEDIKVGDLADDGGQLRPHVVWFGEGVPKMSEAINKVQEADKVIIIGTSMQVYPAASLVGYAKHNTPIYYVDPNPTMSYELKQNKKLTIIEEVATKGVTELVDNLLKD